MTDHYPNVVMNQLRETNVTASGTTAVPVQNGPNIPDDMVRYIYKIKGDNATGAPIRLVVYAGDAAVPNRRTLGRITVQVGVNPASQPNYPDPVDYSAYIFRVPPNTGVAPTQENGIYFGDAVGAQIDNITYEFADKRG